MKSKKLRRKCFYALNVIMGFVFAFSVSCLDSGMWLWYVLSLVSIGYLWFAYKLCEMAGKI